MSKETDPQEEVAEATASWAMPQAETFTGSRFGRSLNTVVVLWIVVLMALTAGVTYVRTAKVQRCHADHILGFIPSGRTCNIENKY